MAPVTRSRAAATSTSPLFQRMKAEAKKDYEMHGKKRREAMPAAIRSSARKSAASKSNVSTSHATTPCITSSKRKHDAIEEEEEATTIKKQKMSHNKQTSAEKRKRAEEVSGEEKEDAPVREIKKLRSTASKQKMAKKDSEENAYEVVSSGSASQATKAKTYTSSGVEPWTLTSIRNRVNVEEINSVTARSDGKFNELTVSGDNFGVRVTTAVCSGKVAMKRTTNRDSKGKQATKGKSIKVENKEERYGEKDGRKGEQDKKEEIKGRLVTSIFDSSTASSTPHQVSKIPMASASRSLPDLFDVEDDYNTDDSFDHDFDSDDDITDSDSDLDTTHMTTPTANSRPFTPLKKKTTTTTATTSTSTSTSFGTTIDNDDEDEDSIPTICTEGVRREKAGLPVIDEEEEKGQKKPIFTEFTNYGNGESSIYICTEERKVKTKAEKKNRTKIEKQNDDMMDEFQARVDYLKKKSYDRAMRNYKPDSKRAIQ